MAPYIEIANASSSDLHRILTVFDAAIEGCKGDYSYAQREAWRASGSHKLHWLEKISKQYFLLASINEQLAGFACLAGGYLDYMYVDPRWQRLGVGRHLYRQIEREAIKHRHTEILTDASISARPFFEKQGFVVLQKNYKARAGEVLINFRMRKGLIQ